VCAQALDLACGSCGGILGPARGKRLAGRGHGERMAGIEPADSIGGQRRHQRAFREFPADGKRGASAPCAQGADPRVEHCRPMCEPQAFPGRSTGDVSADSVVGIRPVEAHQGGTCVRDLWLPVCSPRG